jgi:hypothetical protein
LVRPEICFMPLSPGSRVARKVLLLGLLFVTSTAALAQRHESHAPSILTRPDAVEQKDTLKDFHEALAVQATTQQIAEFQALLKTTDSAKSELEKLLPRPSSTSISTLDQALEAARSQTKKFVDGFSEKQKSGLKEQTRLLDRADAALADQRMKFDQALQISSTPPADEANYASALDKSLTDFSSQQLDLAREMGIVLADAQDVTFNLPAVKSSILVANQPVQLTVSSILSQTAADSSKRTFHLEMMGDLSDFQQNITTVLRAALRNDNPCGEHLIVKRAMVMPSTPASDLHLQLHYERWTCFRIAGQTSTNELAESEGDAEIRLLPAMGPAGLQVRTEYGAIDATGMMGDSLRNGDLGADLREKISRAFLAAMQAAADLKTALPPALQGSATLQTAKFEDTGAGDLVLMLHGEAQLTDEQAKSLASQLNQTLSAEGNGTK